VPTGSYNPKAVFLDYFAGSGTTGHAVINLNREDGGNRKFILVEMGNYFNTVTKPRLKKVIYAKDWKDGKPQNRNTGVPQIFKYIRLESYEDTLNNIELSRTPEQEKQLRMDANFFNQYLVSPRIQTTVPGKPGISPCIEGSLVL
jgi:adenine-specific DNA-methyltransferase